MKNFAQVRTVLLAGTILLQLCPLCFEANGAAGDVDLTFDPGSGVNGTVNAVLVQPDGKVIVGGNFTTVKGLARPYIARLNADGSGDSSFADASPTSPVRALALQVDGKVLFGNGSDNLGLTRLNSDGSPDASFNSNANAAILSTNPFYQPQVSAIVVQPDGKVLYAGESLLRLNADGTLDDSFISGSWGYVNSMVVQPDGKLVVGAYHYDSVSGGSTYELFRLNANGSLDNSFHAEVSGNFTSVVLQPDGKVLICGGIFAEDGTSTGLVARLNADGSMDPTFSVIIGTVGRGTRESVGAIALQSDGKIVMGGQFDSINGSTRNNLARLNADGTLDEGFLIGAGGVSGQPGVYVDVSVKALVIQADGKVIVGGDFTTVNGSPRKRLARLNANGSLDDGFQPGDGVEGQVRALAFQPDGKVLIGGGQYAINGLANGSLRRLTADGSPDGTFDSGTSVNHDVYCIASQPDGKVLIGGSFTEVGGLDKLALARLNADGSVDTGFYPALNGLGYDPIPHPYGGGHSTVVTAIHVLADGTLLVAGYGATEVTGEEVYYVSINFFLEKLNADGTHAVGFNTAGGPGSGSYFYGWYSAPPSSIAIQPDGGILVGGDFAQLSGNNNLNGIARLHADGTVDPSFVPRTEQVFGLSVTALALQPDGKVLAGGGYFGIVNGVERFGIVRFNSDGSMDSTFAAGAGPNEFSGSVNAVAIQPDGKVVMGGSFTTVNGTNRKGIARLNADGSVDYRFDPGTGADGAVVSLAVQPDGNILLGGNFFTVNGEARPHVARLYGNDPPSPTGPGIVIEQPVGTRLDDGITGIGFGTVEPGSAIDRTFAIRSIGLTDLANLVVSIDGVNASEFSVTAQPAGTIPGPDGTGFFTVQFVPRIRGTRTAMLHVMSNDVDHTSFDIALSGARTNEAPMTGPDAVTTDYASAIEIDVLANDSDRDFDGLTISTASTGMNGTTEVMATDLGPRIRYTPGAGFSGVDGFSYTIADGMGGTADGMVQVTVGHPAELLSRTLFSTGAPGSSEDPNGARWKHFGVPSIASNGRIAFTATVITPEGTFSSVNVGSSRGLGIPHAPEYVVAQTGGIALDSPRVRYARFHDPLLNNEGTVVFVAKLTGRNSGGNSGIIMHYESQYYQGPVALAFTNEKPPGVSGARWKAFTSVALSDGAPGEETIAFTATLKGNVNKSNDTGLWLARGGSLDLALREGANVIVDGMSRRVRRFIALQALAGAGGQGHGATGAGVLARVKFDDGTEGVVRVQMDENGPAVTEVARSGDSIEDLEMDLAAFGLPTQSGNGRGAFIASLNGLGNQSAILQSSGLDLELLARTGDPALPNGSAVFEKFMSLANDAGGRVAFIGRVSGDGADQRNNIGVWLHDGVESRLIAREGDQPPGVPAGATWDSFPSLALPDGSGPIFVGRLRASNSADSGRITGANDTGVWAVASTGELRLIARTGDAFDGQRKMVALTLLDTVRGSPTQARSYTGTGELIYRATLSDGSQQIVTVTLP